ncbi:uncharacterized protein [Nicotiana tomentosiformis]|uniref:uncharacterized protein n=1 Tax=Nicotiana tomentosiformis TaxID=4098 RepID=UPI00388C7467
MRSGGNEVTKKALITWDKVCLPKSMGGLNMSNLQVWNAVAIAKTYWDLSHKQDKLWIKWIHAFYIKEQSPKTMPIPKTASWMVRKILKARDVISQIQRQLDAKKSAIKQIHLQLIPNYPKTSWRSLMCQNAARPKVIFTMWLQCQWRLLIVDRLKKWGLHVNDICILYQSSLETSDHLFAECNNSRNLWGRLTQ